MVDLEESTLNGWYAKKVVNGLGEVVCTKCGFKMHLPGGMGSLNIKPHKCKEEKK